MNHQSLFGVNLFEALTKIARLNRRQPITEQPDLAMIDRICCYEPPENKWFLWISEPSGVHCFLEQNVFIVDSEEHKKWCGFAKSPAAENLLAYAGNFTGFMDNQYIGNLFRLDYKSHVQYVKRNSFAREETDYVFQNGSRWTMGPQEEAEYLSDAIKDGGGIKYVHHEPQLPELFQQITQERRSMMLQNTPLERHLTKLKTQLFKQRRQKKDSPEL